VPVIVTVTEPADVNVQDSVEVPEPLATLVGVRVQAELSDPRATVPVNPFNGDMVIVEVPAEPTGTVTEVGRAEIAKSGRPVTVYVTDAE
jgi:hypothetical protein